MSAIEKRPVPAAAYIVSASVTAAAFAMPVTSGGVNEIASFVLNGYAWLAVVVLTVGMFTAPLSLFSEPNKIVSAVFDLSRLCAIAWLVYHGFNLLPALLTACYVMAHCIYQVTKKAYEKQQ